MATDELDIAWMVECKSSDDPVWRFVQPFGTNREARGARDDFKAAEKDDGGTTKFRIRPFDRRKR